MTDYLCAMAICDFYKISHRPLFPKKTQVVYSTWTQRTTRILEIDKTVTCGTQMAFKKLNKIFKDNFFSRPEETVIEEYRILIYETLGDKNPDVEHIRQLHQIGYLPLSVRAIPEGELVPLRVPTFTIQNTLPDFYWLTNYVETFISCETWLAMNSATLAFEYRKILNRYAMETVGNTDFVPFQGHDFSMRGMGGLEAAIISGVGHLLSFVGTDTIPAIQAINHYYGNIKKLLIGTSIAATEHSIQCSYDHDMDYYNAVLDYHKSGFISIVSDGRDFWDVIGNLIPMMKNRIMSRDGKVVIRPDSGDPVLIVCGDPNAPEGSLERKGAVEALWDIFGGTETEKGYKLLDSHIGLIYGDAITLKRCKEICQRLKDKGFASINCVFGIGSFTYQYNTRDTFGGALKSTLCVVDGVEKQIFKDPKTDDGVKKSQKGRVFVVRDGDSYKLIDQCGLEDVMKGDQLREIYRDGKFLIEDDISVIRDRLMAHASN